SRALQGTKARLRRALRIVLRDLREDAQGFGPEQMREIEMRKIEARARLCPRRRRGNRPIERAAAIHIGDAPRSSPCDEVEQARAARPGARKQPVVLGREDET